MRAILGILGLVAVVAIVGLLAKKQLATSIASPAAPTVTGQPAPAASPRQQVDQVKQGLESTLQQARPMPDETK